MKIISKYQDYYDIGLSAGIDKSLLYMRETSEITDIFPINQYQTDFSYGNYLYIVSRLPELAKNETDTEDNVGITRATLLFCGKTYPMLLAVRSADPRSTRAHSQNERLSKEFLGQPDSRKKLVDRIWLEAESAIREISDYRGRSLREATREQILSHFNEINKECTEDLQSVGAPIVLILGEVAIKNPCLKSLGFQSVVDPYTAFQEISMFVGGVLSSPEKNQVEIEDKYIAAGKGYDEWSFRRMPTKKK